MIKIEFPADRPDIAMALGTALVELSKLQCVSNKQDTPVTQHEHEAAPVVEETTAPVEAEIDPIGHGLVREVPKQSSDTRVDHNGVQFNPSFCANAKDPFYGSGKKQGQWKKRKGVSDADYDDWYLGGAQAAQPTTTESDEEPPANTAAAFGAQQFASAVPAANTPTDCGSFMGWVSEKQAAGLLSQDDIGEAYTQAGVQVTDLFPPNDEAVVGRAVSSLYELLSAKAGA